MRYIKEISIYSLLIFNLLVGSINLYINISNSAVVDESVAEHSLSSNSIMLYFYDPNCEFCAEATEMIDKYIEFGYDQFIDIELIDVSIDHKRFLQDYQLEDQQIEDVPSIVLLDMDVIIDQVSGVDNIFELLDDIVSMAKTS